MYSVIDFGKMIADRVRMGAYEQALRQSVRPGSIVLDIGTGTGILAMLACRYGAERVYAIEPEDVIQVARETAARNGLAERIEFIQDVSTRVSLPRRADVIVSDLHGVLPWCTQHLPSIVDARTRLLAPGGVLIPQVDRVYAAVVEAPELYRRVAVPWEERPCGLDLTPARRIAASTWCRARVKPEQVLTEARHWATVDYRVVDQSGVRAELRWTALRAGTGHGFVAWFDATLLDSVGFCNAPTAPETIYSSAFFPWLAPVPLAAGDGIEMTVQAELIGEDYVWRWDTRVLGAEGGDRPKAEFCQSTLGGVPLSPARLRKRTAEHVPVLNGEGLIDYFVLGQFGDGATAGQIASALLRQFPERFADWHSALTRVGELSVKYSQ